MSETNEPTMEYSEFHPVGAPMFVSDALGTIAPILERIAFAIEDIAEAHESQPIQHLEPMPSEAFETPTSAVRNALCVDDTQPSDPHHDPDVDDGWDEEPGEDEE